MDREAHAEVHLSGSAERPLTTPSRKPQNSGSQRVINPKACRSAGGSQRHCAELIGQSSFCPHTSPGRVYTCPLASPSISAPRLTCCPGLPVRRRTGTPAQAGRGRAAPGRQGPIRARWESSFQRWLQWARTRASAPRIPIHDRISSDLLNFRAPCADRTHRAGRRPAD